MGPTCNECGEPATHYETVYFSGEDDEGYWEGQGPDNFWCDKHADNHDCKPIEDK